jgi:hypothetical protein
MRRIKALAMRVNVIDIFLTATIVGLLVALALSL